MSERFSATHEEGGPRAGRADVPSVPRALLVGCHEGVCSQIRAELEGLHASCSSRETVAEALDSLRRTCCPLVLVSEEVRDELCRAIRNELLPEPAHVVVVCAGAGDVDQQLKPGVADVLALDLPPSQRRARLLVALHAAMDRTAREAHLVEAQKLESLSVLAGGVAHDFNNLLMAIMGNTGLALEHSLEPVVREALDEVMVASHRAADLIRQILAYAGKGRVEAVPTRLDRIVRELEPLLRASLPAEAVLDLDLGPARTEADVTQIREIIAHLVRNAGEALPRRGGHVRIRTGTSDVDTERPRCRFVSPDAPPGVYAFVEVRDDGEGMEQPTLVHAFEPFFSTRCYGRGLGLPAALGIVRSHHGAIGLESRPGEGTAVRVLLPAAEPMAGGGP